MEIPSSRNLLEQLSTERLNALLEAYTQSPEPGDENAVLLVLDILQQRELDGGADVPAEIKFAWREFNDFYRASDDPLYPAPSEPAPAPKSTPRKRRRLKRVLVAAAIAAALAVSLIPPAFGRETIFQLFANWDEEQLQFSAVDGQVDELELEAGHYLAPTWIPDGYAAEGGLILENTDFSTDYRMIYTTQDGDMLQYVYSIYSDLELLSSFQFEKNEEEIELYTSNGMTFYIMGNGFKNDSVPDTHTAVFTQGDVMISIFGNNLSRDDIKQIINSLEVMTE